MSRVLAQKWVIGAAALILVLALGTVAWAETGDGQTEDTESELAQSEFAGLEDCIGPPPGMGRMGGSFGPGPAGTPGAWFGAWGGDLTDQEIAEREQRMQERREAQEERRSALHDLIRGQMSDEDKAELDSLEQRAQDKRAEMDQLREDLWETTGQIRELLSKYSPELVPAAGEE